MCILFSDLSFAVCFRFLSPITILCAFYLNELLIFAFKNQVRARLRVCVVVAHLSVVCVCRVCCVCKGRGSRPLARAATDEKKNEASLLSPSNNKKREREKSQVPHHRPRLLQQHKHGGIPGAQAGKVGGEALVKGAGAALPPGLGKAVGDR